MKIKDFFYTEKGRATFAVVSTIIILTVLIVPTTILLDRTIHNDEASVDLGEAVEVWGYDDQVSSTAKKVNTYMGVQTTLTSNIYGGAEAISSEPTLLKNNHYHTVNDDKDILDGVAGAENALGYLSSSWVTGYEATKLRTLYLYNVNTDYYLQNRTDETQYLNPINDEDKLTYTNIGDPDNETEMAATLNISLKVTPDVSNWAKKSLGATPIALQKEDAPVDFINFLNENNYVDDFVLALAFMDYISNDISNIESVNNSVLSGTNSVGTSEFTKESFDVYSKTYKNLSTNSNTWIEEMEKQNLETGNTYSIKVDGTGTNSGLMNIEIDNFSKDFNSSMGTKINFRYDLKNGGSGEAWKISEEGIYGDASTSNSGSDAREDAFLGTQSRFSKTSEVSAFNYSETSYETTKNINGVKMYVDPSETNDGHVLGYTMGIDLPTFFVRDDMTFEYKLNSKLGIEALGGELKEIIPPGEKYATGYEIVFGDKTFSVGDKVKVKPIGISDEGARQIYEFGGSWQHILDSGLMIGEIV